MLRWSTALLIGFAWLKIPKNKQVDDLANEGKKLIRKRQKLIRIADESTDSWKVVDEYVLDELASRSEDEKCLKKAKEAASRKRRQPAQGGSRLDKKFKGTSTLTDQQLFLFAFLFSLSQILPDHFWGTLFPVSLVGVLMRSTHVWLCLFFWGGYLSGKYLAFVWARMYCHRG